MKIISFLSHLTLASSAAFLLGLAFDVQALSLLGIAISSFILLSAFRDYAATNRHFARWQSESHRALQRRGRYTMPYAA